jgi:hypothetical protein
LTAGMVVQTANNGTMEIALQEGDRTPTGSGRRENFLKLYQNSVLALDELQTGAAGEPLILLDLRAGELTAQVNPLPVGKKPGSANGDKPQLSSRSGEFVLLTPRDVLEESVEIGPPNGKPSRVVSTDRSFLATAKTTAVTTRR